MRRPRRQNSQSRWADRLAGLTGDHDARAQTPTAVMEHINKKTSPLRHEKDFLVSLRLEGPYFTPADPSRYQTVVCLVAGTGISGALAISGAFKKLERQLALTTDNDAKLPRLRWSTGGQRGISLHNSRKSSIRLVARDRIWTRCIVLWSVREDTYIDLPIFKSTVHPLRIPCYTNHPLPISHIQVLQPRR
jgi:hypothetical protein